MRVLLMALTALLPAAAQEIKFPASLEKLASKASETVDVTMDQNLLQLASKFLSDRDPDEARAKRLIAGLKGIYVKSFQFDHRGEYQDSDVEEIRSQLKAPNWSRVVGVRSRKDGDNADIFIKTESGQVTGLVVLVAEPRELTFVNIIGPINPEDIRDLGGHFGIPRTPWEFRRGKDKEDFK
jgi:hypothetical protein